VLPPLSQSPDEDRTHVTPVRQSSGSSLLLKGRLPCDDGYVMPAEFERQRGTFLAWPVRADTWRGEKGAKGALTPAQVLMVRLAGVLSSDAAQAVTLLVESKHVKRLFPRLSLVLLCLELSALSS